MILFPGMQRLTLREEFALLSGWLSQRPSWSGDLGLGQFLEEQGWVSREAKISMVIFVVAPLSLLAIQFIFPNSPLTCQLAVTALFLSSLYCEYSLLKRSKLAGIIWSPMLLISIYGMLVILRLV